MVERKRAKPNTPERYLWRKPGARHLWFRMSVPRRFAPVEAKKLIQQSLGTFERKEASVLAAELRVRLTREWDAKLEALRLGDNVPSEAELQAAAATFGFVGTGETVAEWWAEERTTDEDCHAEFIAMLRKRRQRYVEQRETSQADFWRYVAQHLLAEHGWHLRSLEEQDRLGQMIAEAHIDRLGVEIAHRSGDFGAEPTSKAVRAGLSAVSSTAAQSETLESLFESYAEQRVAEGRKRQTTIEQDRIIVRQFARFVGQSRKASSLKQAEVRQWRDTLASLPPGYGSAKAYKGLSLREAAAKARRLGAAKLSPTTVNKYLSTISPLFGWCVRNGYADRNPCDGLFYDLTKGRNPRPPFSPEQLQAIFSSPLFQGFEADGSEHLTGTKMASDWRFWIPVLCRFTGARISEMAQLKIDDFAYDGAVHFVHIRHDEGRGQRTKSATSRVMPLHSRLQGLGILRFVEGHRRRADKDGNTAIFPELSAKERDCLGAGPSRFWRDYLRRIGLKSGADGFGAHSFRHTLADELRSAGFLDEEIAIVLGHSRKTVTSGYGTLRQGTAQVIYRMIEKLKFDDLIQLNRQTNKG